MAPIREEEEKKGSPSLPTDQPARKKEAKRPEKATKQKEDTGKLVYRPKLQPKEQEASKQAAKRTQLQSKPQSKEHKPKEQRPAQSKPRFTRTTE
jgi:hypothetical protein